MGVEDLATAEYGNLHADEQLMLGAWDRDIRLRAGLWVYGSRRSGTSYIGAVAARHLLSEQVDPSWEYVTAMDLMKKIRSFWGQEKGTQQHPDDYGLWVDYSITEASLDQIWNGALLWVDDLNDASIEMSFWRKHVMPSIEARVKKGLPTIICTTMVPDNPNLGVGYMQVIIDLFTIVRAEGQWRGEG